MEGAIQVPSQDPWTWGWRNFAAIANFRAVLHSNGGPWLIFESNRITNYMHVLMQQRLKDQRYIGEKKDYGSLQGSCSVRPAFLPAALSEVSQGQGLKS